MQNNIKTIDRQEPSANTEPTWRPESCWTELQGGKDEMQRIIALLVEFDEKTGRVNRYSDPASHWMRKAVAVCDPDNLRIFVKHSADWTYLVTVHLTASTGSIKTSWVHEDGIRSEREQAASDHPVHKITCLSDLVAQHGKPVEPSLTAELDSPA